MLFDQVICFDNYKQKIVLIANVAVDDLEKSYHEALVKLEKMQALIISGVKAKIEPLRLKSDFKALFEQNEYCNMVERAKKYIKEGDIFQVVLSNCLEAEVTGSLFDTYRVLRTTNPSPYMFYFFSDDQEFAGASPDTLVKLEDKNLYTYPLAGTRPRGMNENEVVNFEVSLLSDQKELAEHNMLVDLGRNDIGRISKFGTVKVEKYQEILRFSHVMKIGSNVSGVIL